jgi:hypothetical protein
MGPEPTEAENEFQKAMDRILYGVSFEDVTGKRIDPTTVSGYGHGRHFRRIDLPRLLAERDEPDLPPQPEQPDLEDDDFA